MNYKRAKEKILLLLDDLSDDLYYHGKLHTLDVLNITSELADLEGVDEYHTLLLQTAALLHDSGFTINNKEHEKLGCQIANDILPEYGYTEGEINIISSMIMATKVPQSPQNLYEQILCDADLDYLGRDDFKEIGDRLFKELVAYQVISDRKTWNKIQIGFLEKHKYFTKTNVNRREPFKQNHLENLKEIVAKY